MPLRDHFHHRRGFSGWEAFHHEWVSSLLRSLNRILPPLYRAEPSIHLGVYAEPDVTTLEREPDLFDEVRPTGNGTATAVWSPPQATATLEIDAPARDWHEVRVLDTESGDRVVAALELVSPSNKDRDSHRDSFLGKCAALLEKQACVAMIDVVTERSANLHAALLRRLGGPVGVEPMAGGALYATVYRNAKVGGAWKLDVWAYELAVGRELPTPPLWIAPHLAVPVELEATHEETGRVLRRW